MTVDSDAPIIRLWEINLVDGWVNMNDT